MLQLFHELTSGESKNSCSRFKLILCVVFSPTSVTSVILTVTLELWIATDICYVFRPVEPDFEVKNIEKWPLGWPHGP